MFQITRRTIAYTASTFITIVEKARFVRIVTDSAAVVGQSISLMLRFSMLMLTNSLPRPKTITLRSDFAVLGSLDLTMRQFTDWLTTEIHTFLRINSFYHSILHCGSHFKTWLDRIVRLRLFEYTVYMDCNRCFEYTGWWPKKVSHYQMIKISY